MAMWKLRTFFNSVLLICVMGLFSACDQEMPQESFGLDHVIALDVASEDLAVMRHGTYSKSVVPVSLQIDGEYREGVIAVAGASSVDDYKKSYEIELDEPYLGKRVFRLNAMSRDPSAMHAMTAYHVFNLAGVQTPFLEPIAVWLNDKYAGLYLFQEKYDDDYFASISQQPASLYQAENSVAAMGTESNFDVAFSVKIGNHEMVDLKHMLNAVQAYAKNGDVEMLAKYVDIPSLINYMAITSYIHHSDGLDNNYYLLRKEGSPMFTILPWDLDHSFVAIHDVTDTSLLERNLLMRSLLENNKITREQYELRYKQVALKADARTLSAYVDSLANQISEAYQADPALGNQDLTLDDHAANLKLHFEEMENCAFGGQPDTIDVE